MSELKPTQALDLWRTVLVETVRSAGPDLSSRQLAIVLTVYLTPPPHTVRGLASLLKISKPAVTRALDRLGMLGLARRRRDTADRRSVLVQRTLKGAAFLRDLRSIMTDASAAPRKAIRTWSGSCLTRTGTKPPDNPCSSI